MVPERGDAMLTHVARGESDVSVCSAGRDRYKPALVLLAETLKPRAPGLGTNVPSGHLQFSLLHGRVLPPAPLTGLRGPSRRRAASFRALGSYRAAGRGAARAWRSPTCGALRLARESLGRCRIPAFTFQGATGRARATTRRLSCCLGRVTCRSRTPFRGRFRTRRRPSQLHACTPRLR